MIIYPFLRTEELKLRHGGNREQILRLFRINMVENSAALIVLRHEVLSLVVPCTGQHGACIESNGGIIWVNAVKERDDFLCPHLVLVAVCRGC